MNNINICRGNKQISNVYIGDRLVTTPIYNKNMIGLYESLNKDNNSKLSRSKWNDSSGNNNILNLVNMEYEDINGWICNSLIFNNRSYCEGSIKSLPVEFSYQFGVVINKNNTLSMSLPCIDYIVSNGNNIEIRFSDKNIITIENVIDFDILNQFIITYKDGIFNFYKEDKLINKYNVQISSNKSIMIGKNIYNVYGNFKCNYLILYDKILSLNMREKNINNMYYRYINYHSDGLVLDLRGKDNLLDYKPNRYIRDNSIYGNHFLVDFFFTSVNSHTRRSTYRFNGYNKITCEGRKLIYDEFTVETVVQGNEELLSNKTYLCGNYSKNNFGFKIGLDTLGFVVEFTNGKETKLITYGMEYIRRMVHLAVTYKNGMVTMYVNGFKVKEESFDFKNFYNNFNFFIAKQDLDDWDGYKGLMNSLRIYNKVIDIEVLKNNFYIDRQFYPV